MPAPRRVITIPALACALLTVWFGAAGCTASGGETPSASTTPSASASTPAPTREAARIVPDGTAEENLPVFAEAVESVWAGGDRASGRAYIDALVAAGFDKASMQVTNDLSTVGNPAESIEFSVLWRGEQCLVGQVGPTVADPVAKVMPALPGDRCLLGATRPIDW